MRAYCPADYAPAQLLVESSAFVPAPCHWQPADVAAHARQPPHDAAARFWEPPHDSLARVWEPTHASSARAWQRAAGRETGCDSEWMEAGGQPYPGTSLWDPSNASRAGAAEQAPCPETYMEAWGAHAQRGAAHHAEAAWHVPSRTPYDHWGRGEPDQWAEQGYTVPHPNGALQARRCAPAEPCQGGWQTALNAAFAHPAHTLERGGAPGAGADPGAAARQRALGQGHGDLRTERADSMDAAAAAPERRATAVAERAALEHRAAAAEERAAAAAARAEELALALAAKDTELATLHRY